MTTPLTRGRTGRPTGGSAGWPIPAGLLAISPIPVTAGSLRLVQLAGGPALMPADDRFAGILVALTAHITGAATYAILGAQFVTAIRHRRPAWHRRAGRVLTVAGLLVAGSALWITLTHDAQPGTGPLLLGFRLLVAPAMGTALLLGFAEIRRRDIRAHRAWMIRAYAMGLGAGTQVFTEGIGGAETRTDRVRAAGWVLNIAVAECGIRRRTVGRRERRYRPSPAVATAPMSGELR